MPDEELLGTEAAPEEASAVEEPEVPTDEQLGQETPAAATAEVTTVEPEAPEQKKVPLAALHEERERRKELSAKLEESDRRHTADMAKLQERTNIILQSLQQAMEPPKGSDDPLFIQQFMAANPGVSRETAEEAFLNEEPNNYLKWRQDRLQKEHGELVQRAHKQDQQIKAQQEFGNFVAAYQTQATEFTTATPDFKDAYGWLMQHRDKELVTLGFKDPVQRRQIMQSEEVGIVEQAFRDQINPAQRLYDIAKFRGYKMTEPAKPGTPAAQANLDKERKAEAASKSLGSVPGSPSTKLTAEVLLNMSDEEFAEATKGAKWQGVFST